MTNRRSRGWSVGACVVIALMLSGFRDGASTAPRPAGDTPRPRVACSSTGARDETRDVAGADFRHGIGIGGWQ